MEHILPVYAPPWAEPLSVTTVIPNKDDAIDVLTHYLANDDFTLSTWFTDGSLMEGSAGGAAIWLVAEGEIEGLLQATVWAILLGAHHILVVSDSQAGLKAVLTTRPRAGQHRAVLYNCLVRTVLQSHPDLQIVNLWMPARIGTEGNELANDAAKAATLLPPPLLPILLTSCRAAASGISTALLPASFCTPHTPYSSALPLADISTVV
ncbi:hypothetical protein K438DRAFT_1995724 [Mycena galopus ATCC 62051]|nr:hypothetical protein K438DRAFT_1995724 [Mycena galopus ATCC 62051]